MRALLIVRSGLKYSWEVEVERYHLQILILILSSLYKKHEIDTGYFLFCWKYIQV